jgi:hypothetical protein
LINTYSHLAHIGLDDLLKGRIEKFSLGALVNTLAGTGMVVKMTVRKAAWIPCYFPGYQKNWLARGEQAKGGKSGRSEWVKH